MDTGQRPRAARVEGDDARVGKGRTEQAAVQHARQEEVVGEARLTRDLGPAVHPAPGPADEARLFESGLVAPVGTRAIALPLGPSAALGGAVVPGTRVDVVAIPVTGRAPSGRLTELLATGALVLDVRSESGAPLAIVGRRPVASATAERLGSVVLALPAQQALVVADRIGASTFVLALSAR